jgi:hypothetical protein
LSDELCPHMWEVAASSENPPENEWFVCSCGLKGTARDPRQPHSWPPLWNEIAEHLIAVGQITVEAAGDDPFAGSGGSKLHNPLWAFRSDMAPEERRAAREYFGIPPCASGT